MPTASGGPDSVRRSWPRRLALGSFVAMAAFVVSYVAVLVDRNTIVVVADRWLLPRWDLATHLDLGWMDYYLLVTGKIHRLIWDLWLQGYWPPVLSIYQVPFYLAFGAGMTSGLLSALTAFVLTGVAGSMLLWRQWRR